MKDYMDVAISEAKTAYKKNEVPIGACIVINGKIISKAHNLREKKKNALCHAEIMCINKACKKMKSWRLENAVIYVTNEPCPMCAGAIVNARIGKLVYASKSTNTKTTQLEDILKNSQLNHKTESEYQDSDEAMALLSNFFKEKRKKS